MNFCIYMAMQSTLLVVAVAYLLFGNAVVAQTLYSRNLRVPESNQSSDDSVVVDGGSSNTSVRELAVDALNADDDSQNGKNTTTTATGGGGGAGAHDKAAADGAPSTLSSAAAIVAAGGKPKAGSTFTESLAPPRNSPSHTWCRVHPRQFQVRARGYDKHKRKDPSLSAIYEPIAVDVFW
jgi:hypothetical protein